MTDIVIYEQQWLTWLHEIWENVHTLEQSVDNKRLRALEKKIIKQHNLHHSVMQPLSSQCWHSVNTMSRIMRKRLLKPEMIPHLLSQWVTKPWQAKQLANYFEKQLAFMKTVRFLEMFGPIACSAPQASPSRWLKRNLWEQVIQSCGYHEWYRDLYTTLVDLASWENVLFGTKY